MTLDVAVVGPDGVTVARTWALNEVVVQNDTHRGVLELVTGSTGGRSRRSVPTAS